MQKKSIRKIWIYLFTLIYVFIGINSAYAVNTVPQKYIYEGRLLNNAGDTPLVTSHTFRFSLWSASAVVVGDVPGGAINTLAPSYGGWHEAQTVIPNIDGFFSFELGSIIPLPVIDYTKHLYLQVEVKQTGQADSAYEILDRAPADPASDRSPIGSVPYALNADLIDNREIGTSTGDIVVLDTGDIWPISTVPGGTNEDVFVLDNDDDAVGTVDLQFGNALGKILSWDLLSNYFNFNDDVNIQGDLTITGNVDGVDISNLAANVNSHFDGGASKHDASEIDVEAVDGHYYFAGDVESAIDDLDEQLFTLTSSTTNQKLTLTTSYDGVSLKPDGTNNIGRLYTDTDLPNGRNYYIWRSTPGNLQDYDVIIQVPLPADFSSWDGATPWTFNYRSTNAAASENKADIYIYDTAGSLVTLSGTSTDLVNTTWSGTSLGYGGSPTFTAGDTFIIVIRMSSRSGEEMHIGEIVLDYIQS